VWWLAPLPHSERVPGSIPGWALSVWSLHVLPVYVWVLSGYSGFLPLSRRLVFVSLNQMFPSSNTPDSNEWLLIRPLQSFMTS